MSFATRLMLGMLLVNFCAGILGFALSPLYTDLDEKLPIGYNYEEDRDTTGIDSWDSTEIGMPVAGSDTTWLLRLLDFISLGYFTKIQALLRSTIFGLSGMFQSIFNMNERYVYFMDAIISVVYIVGIVELFTGRRLNE